MKHEVTFFWFRRDLRLADNVGLYHALSNNKNVVPLFIFDENILQNLEKSDSRVNFIFDTIINIKNELRQFGKDILVKVGSPLQIWYDLLEQYDVKNIYYNHDYEPYATERDAQINKLAGNYGVNVFSFKDHLIFEKDEILKDNGKPYTVFTPYSRKWKSIFSITQINDYNSYQYKENFLTVHFNDDLSLENIGFKQSTLIIPDPQFNLKIIENYYKNRDFPSLNGTSKLGIHLRFGTISIRKLAIAAHSLSEVYINELIWRDFYAMILYHFPYVVNGAFKQDYDKIEWLNDEINFEKWKMGTTGYPIVDAGMRELNNTGFMHNRVRMITASFLTKHLLIDWRWGEAYFAQKLLDFDLASNNGGWQWAASCGCDAAPYFRVFNPELQTQKFDPNLIYIKKWVPEFQSFNYPKPIVDHKYARERVLKVFKDALN